MVFARRGFFSVKNLTFILLHSYVTISQKMVSLNYLQISAGLAEHIVCPYLLGQRASEGDGMLHFLSSIFVDMPYQQHKDYTFSLSSARTVRPSGQRICMPIIRRYLFAAILFLICIPHYTIIKKLEKVKSLVKSICRDTRRNGVMISNWQSISDAR